MTSVERCSHPAARSIP